MLIYNSETVVLLNIFLEPVTFFFDQVKKNSIYSK